MISIIYKMEDFFVVIIHMNVARAAFLLFYDDFMITKTPKQSNWK